MLPLIAGSAEGQFKFPRGVAVDENGFIIVGDSGNNRIQVFNPDGTFLKVRYVFIQYLSSLLTHFYPLNSTRHSVNGAVAKESLKAWRAWRLTPILEF